MRNAQINDVTDIKKSRILFEFLIDPKNFNQTVFKDKLINSLLICAAMWMYVCRAGACGVAAIVSSLFVLPSHTATSTQPTPVIQLARLNCTAIH